MGIIDYDDVEYIPPLGADATTATTGYFSSPEDLLNAAQQLNSFIAAMAGVVAAKKSWSGVPAGTGALLQAFFDSWSSFYASDFSNRALVLLHWATSNLQGNLANFQAQAADWAKKLKKWGVKIEGPAPPEAGAGGASNTFMWIGIGAVALVGLFMIGKLVHTVALGNAALTDAENEAMQIADEKKRKKADKTAYSIS